MEKKKSIMVVGTSSGAGKSILVTGLCRVFYKDGYKVSPFKSQNMALNSYITKNGNEMGRAQVVQAMAANIEPLSIMNPILLKPTTLNKIQVIIKGKSTGNMSGIEYNKYKKTLKPMLKETFEELKSEYDIVVIEGAGSPVEINITEEDISNMGMAKIAETPVILVADIDRGGVFASIYGTIMLLKEEDKKRVKGVIINKFRGNIEVLKPGFKMIEDLTGVPVLGVLPYSDIDIEDEDSISEKFKKSSKNQKNIKISVIKLKHIANLTDIDGIFVNDDVQINLVDKFEDLGDEDIIIIPGSKNTIEDLKQIKENGIAREIIKSSRKDTLIIGICGGFQMLGEKVKDPYSIETEIAEIPGLGLLNLETVIEKEKKTVQYKNKICNSVGILKPLNGKEILGYEIHQGKSYGEENRVTDDEAITFVEKKNILGTYIHGIFENKEFTDHILNIVRQKKGINLKESEKSFEEYREEQFDKLEKLLRENLDMNKIYEIMKDYKGDI